MIIVWFVRMKWKCISRVSMIIYILNTRIRTRHTHGVHASVDVTQWTPLASLPPLMHACEMKDVIAFHTQ